MRMERAHRPSLSRNPTSESFRDERAARNPRARQSTPSTHDSRRSTSTTARASSPEGPLFACPYSKHDPLRYSHKNLEEHDYRNCSTGYWTSIPRLKQHLYRSHDRSQRCCPRCWQNFPNDEALRRHMGSQDCQARPIPEEKMDEEKHQKVKERIQGQPVESWYKIYHVLFPDDDLPPSAFAEWVIGEDLRSCFETLAERLPRILFQAAVQQGVTARNTPFQKNTQFLTTPGVVQQALLHCQKEFARNEGFNHIFATESPTFTRTSRSTTARSRQSEAPRQAQRSRNPSEDDDSSSGASHYGPATYQPSYASSGTAVPGNMPYPAMMYHASTSNPMDVVMYGTSTLPEEVYPPYYTEGNYDNDWPQH